MKRFPNPWQNFSFLIHTIPFYSRNNWHFISLFFIPRSHIVPSFSANDGDFNQSISLSSFIHHPILQHKQHHPILQHKWCRFQSDHLSSLVHSSSHPIAQMMYISISPFLFPCSHIIASYSRSNGDFCQLTWGLMTTPEARQVSCCLSPLAAPLSDWHSLPERLGSWRCVCTSRSCKHVSDRWHLHIQNIQGTQQQWSCSSN